ncbi:MAG: hypothetical protein GY810_19450 [Aureispira sp.]|nr:hypothetical protein [Aureispira sp.]
MLRNCLLYLLCFPLLGFAQDSKESIFSQSPKELNLDAPKSSHIREYYYNYLNNYGQDQILGACEAALEAYGEENEEYATKLLNLLARNYQLTYQLDEAKTYYKRVLETEFKKDYYAEGTIASREKLVALAGMREVAMLEKDYSTALGYHQQYTQNLYAEYKELYLRNQSRNDKFLALCYQKMGKSEKAIETLIPYAFGKGVHAGGGLDKQMVDQLAELLLTKYPKKALRKLLPIIHTEIYGETTKNEVRFYLKMFDNKIYFPQDTYQYHTKIKEGQAIEGQAVAHYQRKLCNSYFFQRLVSLL